MSMIWVDTASKSLKHTSMVLRLCDWKQHNIKIFKLAKLETSVRSEIDPTTVDLAEKVALDLHAGGIATFPNNNSTNEVHQTFVKHIQIPPHSCARITTEEEIVVPKDIFGFICCRHSMSVKGLWVANAKIDPYYGDGPFGFSLEVTVLNTTPKTLRLARGEGFCTIVFMKLAGDVDGSARRPGQFSRPATSRARQAWEMCKSTVIPSVISAITALLVAYLTYKMTHSNIPATPAQVVKPSAIIANQPAQSTPTLPDQPH
jgi:deoxycytidine triphosphate deaminase